MTTVRPISATLGLPVRVLRAAPERYGSHLAAAGISFAALAFLAGSACALYLNWRVGIAVVVIASVAGVLGANRAVRAGLLVDREPDAFDRMLRENEKQYAPTLTGIDAELTLLARRLRTRASNPEASVPPGAHPSEDV